MRCDDALQAVSAVADGETLDPVDDDALAEHLAGCAECRAFEASVRRLRTALRFEAVGEVPNVVPALRSRIATADTEVEVEAEVEAEVESESETDSVLLAGFGVGAPKPANRTVEGRGADGDQGRRWPRLVRGQRGQRWWVPVAAAGVVGFVVGAAVVGIGRQPGREAMADIPGRVLAAQRELDSLDARFRLTEHGRPELSGGVGYEGRLVYEAPERLALSLWSTPDTDREPDVHLVVDEDRSWLSSVRTCSPVPGKVACPTATQRWTEAVIGREPFSESTTNPLELVTAVDSFALAADPEPLGERQVAGHDAVGVRLDAAHVAPFLDALSPTDALRAVHPTDPVDLWLDREHLVPLALEVRAGPSDERDRWATTHGYRDRPGDPVLSYEVTSATIDQGIPAQAIDPPPAPDTTSESTTGGTEPTPPQPGGSGTGSSAGNGGTVRDDGFVADPEAAGVVPEPTRLPEGMRPYLSGVVAAPGGPEVGVRTWTDGRAWAKVRATRAWDRSQLFGGLGTPVRPVDLGDAGIAYTNAAGDRVALHGDDLDVVVTGSLAPDELTALAASLGIVGRPVPDDWPEAATAPLDEAARRPGELLTADGLDGFSPPAVRVAGDTVTQVYAGPGDRSFALVQRDEAALPPPTDPHSIGVRVRGVAGRYSVENGDLEWVEDGVAYSLSSPSLSLDELLAVATRLRDVDGS